MASDEESRSSANRRRRGSRGGRTTRRPGDGEPGDAAENDGPVRPERARAPKAAILGPDAPDLPDPPSEGRAAPEAGARALVRRPDLGASRPKIGDTRPAPPPTAGDDGSAAATPTRSPGRRGPGGQPPKARTAAAERMADDSDGEVDGDDDSPARKRRRRGGRGRGTTVGGKALGGTPEPEAPVELDEETLERRRGRERKGKPVGRYQMCVHVRPEATQIAVLEGRSLIEHYVSRPSDDASQIHGNIYIGRVQNVLPGMEAAFVDIGTPKNAVLYRGDVQYDSEDVDEKGPGGKGGGGGGGGKDNDVRIEQLLRPGQTVLCQVTKNPIGTKGARLTQEVSLAGRFVVLIPNSTTYGISKRLSDEERKRLRRILDEVRPPGQGLIVRTAAEGATPEELRRDVERLLKQWGQIEALAARSNAPTLLYREPPLAVRVIREEFNKDYRGVLIDDVELHREVHEYVAALIPELADRIELYDDPALPIFERQHVHEQLHKALDRKVWLPSGGSLIIERTEALTVIDVNTGKNVGTKNLEETVFRNNLEAAEEIARQLRLRDIGGIIVIDFIDMEIRKNREQVLKLFKDCLARDKTRTQVFDISELGLVEMTRKRVSEGLVESFSAICPNCNGRGIILDESLL
ncbi:MAG: Ribonuclease E [uncultured Acidimicrobiales bacterium]|uniref:Ribonuclease E n=1 Tax=uncultured Acidimicrobiales bacterium TaxID=310071 RepID=A0A6J4IZF0_9ACTN|nr:MAG: Ribonuclease E [uncultured Acidimicrobiales bacterium]